MITQSLNGVWSAASADDEIRLGVPVPGSVYSEIGRASCRERV